MSARNDITGDAIATKQTTEVYRDGWDRIFGKKNAQPSVKAPEPSVNETKKQRDELVKLWWKYCEENQKTHIPLFADWRAYELSNLINPKETQ